jgi:hypothetical protein
MLKQSKSTINFPILLLLLAVPASFVAGYSLANRQEPTKHASLKVSDLTNNNQLNTENVFTKYYPLQKGNYWEYEGIKKETQPGGAIETANTKGKVEVIDVQETEEGTVVSLDDGSDYLIKGNDVYSRTSRGDELRLPFPLYVGQKWGYEDSIRFRDDNFYMVYVEEKLSKTILGKKYDECFKITDKVISAPTAYQIFCYGIGYVESFYEHKGTVDERNSQLVNTNVD